VSKVLKTENEVNFQETNKSIREVQELSATEGGVQDQALTSSLGTSHINPVLYLDIDKNFKIPEDMTEIQFWAWYESLESQDSGFPNIISLNTNLDQLKIIEYSQSLTVFPGTWYFKDKERVYSNGLQIVGADPETFYALGKCGFKGISSYAKDKNHVYTGSNIVESVDVPTFELVGSFDITSEGMPIIYCVTKDKNCIYHNDKKVLDVGGVCINPINCTKDTLANSCGLNIFSKTIELNSPAIEESMARDYIRGFNFVRIQNILENYYIKYGKYPSIPVDQAQTWTNLKSVLLNSGVASGEIESVVMDPLYPIQDYGYYLYDITPTLKSYILTAKFENLNSEKLKNDLDGSISGIDCEDPIYCLRF